MFGNPSLITRIAIGKGIGFLFGLAGFILIPYFLPEADWQLRWGILLWYTTMGAFIGVFGVFTYHPVLKLPFPLPPGLAAKVKKPLVNEAMIKNNI